MLRDHGDWMELGSTDEGKPAKDGTVEAWARSPDNPVGGWYGLRKGYRGRFAMYIPPLLEELGLVELEHNPRNNRVRASDGLPLRLRRGLGDEMGEFVERHRPADGARGVARDAGMGHHHPRAACDRRQLDADGCRAVSGTRTTPPGDVDRRGCELWVVRVGSGGGDAGGAGGKP